MAHSHPVIDADTRFEIDGVTRLVKNVTETKTMLVQFDHNSERFTFKVPRYVDGHDLSLCNLVRVHYINIEKSKRTENSGIYKVTDLAVCPDDEQFVTCSWLVPDTATQLVGSLHFVIQFACLENDNVLYSWNTARHTSVTVTDGLDCGDFVVRENESILTKWKEQLEANQITDIEQTTVSTEDNGENVWTVTFGDGRTRELKVKNGSRGNTGYVGSIQTLNGDILHFYVGSKEGYQDFKALETDANVIAFFTDDSTMEQVMSVIEAVEGILDGTILVNATTSEKLNSGFTKYYVPSNSTYVTVDLVPNKAYAIHFNWQLSSNFYSVVLCVNNTPSTNIYYSTLSACTNTSGSSGTGGSSYAVFVTAEYNGGQTILRLKDVAGNSLRPYDGYFYVREL